MDKMKGMAIASLVLGGLAFLSSGLFASYIEFSLAILILLQISWVLTSVSGVILGIFARKDSRAAIRTCAIIGLGCSLIELIHALITYLIKYSVLIIFTGA